MRKIILFSFLIAGSNTLCLAQNADEFYDTSYERRNSGSFNRATGILSFGYGFSNQIGTSYNYISGSSATSRVNFGPVYAKYEHGIIRDDIGLGGQMAFSNTWIKYNNANTSYKDNVSAFNFAMLVYYHFNKLIPVSHLDVYVGTGASIRTLWYNYDSNLTENPGNHTATNIYATGKIGARYYVKRNFGLYAEAGFDNMSDVNLGISFKL